MIMVIRGQPLSKTGKFPQSPKSPGEFRKEQMEGQKHFKGSTPSKGFGGYSANTTREKDRGPYGSLKVLGGGNKGNTVAVKDGAIKQPSKPRTHMTEKLPLTKNTFGLFHPIRGEGPSHEVGS
jgi:hypothetical protein